jgi:ABC-2 type transport system ATP-binding protein
MSASPVIRVEGLTKSFEGVHAVSDVSFELQRGQVVGFIGANGAGKTTTMRMMATLEVPDRGSIHVGDFNVLEHPAEVRRLIGWMPDSYGAYAYVTVFDYLDFYARACGFRGAERERRLAEIMEFADLTPMATRPMNGLSKGMAQRLCFGRALLQEPAVLILDEPAAGLDPKARIEFKNLVNLLRKKGTTIFISSHILSELSEMCDSLLFIDQGRIVHHGTAEALQRHHGAADCVIDIQVHGPEEPLIQWLEMSPDWTLVARGRSGARAAFTGSDRDLLAGELRRMISDGVLVSDFHRQERRLEDVFVDVLKGSNGSTTAPPPLPSFARP